jgi:hypothetical protein
MDTWAVTGLLLTVPSQASFTRAFCVACDDSVGNVSRYYKTPKIFIMTLTPEPGS